MLWAGLTVRLKSISANAPKESRNMAKNGQLLESAASALMIKEPGYWGDFPKEFLIAWLRDARDDHSVRCSYCDLPLMSLEPTSFRNGTVDHVLPKSRYPQLALDRSNAVPCCYRCNAIKGRWDPNKDDPPYKGLSEPLTDEERAELVSRAKAYVQLKLSTAHPRIWECWETACHNSGQPEDTGAYTGAAPSNP